MSTPISPTWPAAGEAVINEAIPLVFDVQRSRLAPLGSEGQQRLVQELTRFAEVIDTWPPNGERS